MLSLASPKGAGIVRDDVDASAVRAWTDPQMYSHAAFVPAIAASALVTPGLPELALLQSVTLALSLGYHRQYERPSRLATAESVSAKLLFLYGAVQTTQSPSEALLVANSACFALTLGTFVLTNLDKSLYERWHPLGLHVVPGAWSFFVATGHTSLLPPAALAAFT